MRIPMDEKRIYTLFLKYKAGRLSASEQEELKAWLDASADHREQFVSFLRLYKCGMQYRMLDRLDAESAWRRVARRYKRVPMWRCWLRWGVAAVLLGCCWLGYTYYYSSAEADAGLAELFPNHGTRHALFVSSDGQVWSQTDSVFTWLDPSELSVQPSEYQWHKYTSIPHGKRTNEVHVPRGGEYSLVLADGTKVWLNACSTLRFSYPFDSLRVVNLEGEAYFEVAHNVKPFEVHADGGVVRVLGTKFDVRAYAGQPFRVTLAEGSVQVKNGDRERLLRPDEQLTAVEGGDYEVQEVNAALATAWPRGEFEFDNAPLGEIVCQLERWYDVDMTYASDGLDAIRFTGTILRKESLGYALEMIQKVSDVRFSKRGDGVLIERK